MRKRGGLDVGLLLMLIGASVIIAWALLKSFGIINTPVWIEMVPYVASGVSIFGAIAFFVNLFAEVRYIGNTVRRIENMRDDFIGVKTTQKLCLDGKLKGSPYVR